MKNKICIDTSNILIRGIESSDIPLVKNFKCGNGSLDNFLKNEAYIADISRDGSTSLVFYGEELIGYFTLKRSDLKIEGMEQLSHKTSLDIARIAIVKDYQEYGIGSYVLNHIVVNLASRINERFISLDAVYEYWKWYENRGFNYLIEQEVDPNNPSDLVYMIMDLYDEDLVDQYFDEVV